MASPAEVAQPLPETLPANFSEWDGGDVQPTPPVKSNAFEPPADSVAAAKPPIHLTNSHITLSPAVDPSRNAPSHTPSTVNANDEALSQSRRSNGAADYEVLPISPIAPAAKYDNDEGLFRSFGANSESGEGLELTGKKRMIAVVGAVGSILILLALVLMFNPALRHSLFNVKQSVAPQPRATDTDTTTSTPKPSPSTQLTDNAQPTTAATQSPVTDAKSATEADLTTTPEDATAPQVPSKMMHDQLAAPSRISRDIKTVDGKDAPTTAGFGAGGMEGLGGGTAAIGSVFSRQGGPKVKGDATKTLKISAGVAAGLLIQKSAPVYPAIAKASRTSGTVVLQATISKTGTIDHLHAVSGSAMLQQSAMDAVRTWRYKPYKLNNEPVEVETTISVIFSFGK
jgi:TonB family protein